MGEIFIVAEHRKGEVREVTYQMLWKANDLCQKLSQTLTVVLIGARDEPFLRRFGAGHMLDLSWGRSLYRIKMDEQQRTTKWLRLVGRVELTRHFFVVSDLEYDTGDDLQGPRVFLELGSVF